MKIIYGTMLGFALLLSGCGGSDDSTSETGAESLAGSDWGADACKTLTAEAAGKASGLAVAKSSASSVARVGDNTVSTCSYSASDGTQFTVALRQSPDATMAESIAGLEANPDMTGPVEAVPAPVGKAFWAPQVKTLTYLPDDHRMVSVTPPGANVMGGKSDSDDLLKPRALAIALAAAN